MLPHERPSTLALLALGALALGIRLYHLDARDLWEDEQVTLIDSLGVGMPAEEERGGTFPASRLHSSPSPIAIARFSASHDQPIYVTLIHLWTRLVPPTEWTLRLPSALMGALTVPLLALLGWRLQGRLQGLWAATLLAATSLHVSYSQEARTYAITIFLVVLSSLACVFAGETRNRWAWIGYGAVAATVPALHLLAAVALLPQGVWLASRPATRRPLVHALISGVVLLSLLAPLGFFQSVITAHQDSGLALQHPPPELQGWAVPTSFSRLVSGLGATTTRLLGIEYPGFGVRARAALWLSGPLVALGIFGALRMRLRSVAFFVTATALLPLVTATLLSLAYGHVVPLQDRYSAWSMPFIALLLAEGIVHLAPSLSRGIGTAVLVVLGIFLARMQLPSPPRMTPRAREVARLSACAREGQVLRANDNTEAAVVAAWARSPLLLEVGGERATPPLTAWEVTPGTGTVCRTTAGSGCDAEFPLCGRSGPGQGSEGSSVGVQP